MKPILYHPDARAEADDGAFYYYEKSPQAARDFIALLDQVISSIQAFPHLGSSFRKTAIQRRHLKRFPYTVFYVNESDRVWILAIAHTSRRPGYWLRRFK